MQCELTAAIADKQAKSEIIGNFIKTIKKMDGMVEMFDESLWGGMVEYATAFHKKKVVLPLKETLRLQLNIIYNWENGIILRVQLKEKRFAS